MHRLFKFAAVAIAMAVPSSGVAELTLEYIGHASFVVESATGTRVVIDPFSSTRWLGYQFPGEVPADAVLVSHPHYDHDASYYWGDSTPVFREPGEYRVGDVRITGVTGRHADPYGKDFGQKNTLWLIDAGGIRVLHVGDNGPLTPENFAEIGTVDVLMVPADGQDHILKPEAIAAAEHALKPRIVVPMHYRLEGFLGLPRSLGPVDPWLARRESVTRLDSHRLRVSAETPAGTFRFLPSPDLRPWSEGLTEGWQLLDSARKLATDDAQAQGRAFELVKLAHEGDSSIVFAYQWARALGEAKRYAEATTVLERALAGAILDDWEFRCRAHALLGNLYEIAEEWDSARIQYLWVTRHSYRPELLDQAGEFLDKHQSR